MNLYRFLLFYFFIQVEKSSPFAVNSFSKSLNNDNSTGIQTSFSKLGLLDGDEDSGSDERVRIEDYCSFTKLEKKVEPVPDLEECERVNEHFKVNEDYSFINYFGYVFDLLKRGVDSVSFPSSKYKTNAIFFVGITGSGKSTLVQILGTDNRKIFSKPVNEEKTDFIIVDNSKIGTDTVISETLYPELIIDKETNYLLCDNPGFRDTRSPIHEIVAMYSMKKVLQHTNKIKIVIVTTHSSVRTGMYRSDFTNLLQHIIDFFKNIEKYKNSFYLIANKVENTVVKEHEKIEIVSDKRIMYDIGHFLSTVKSSITAKVSTKNISSVYSEEFVKNAINIIDGILEQDDSNYKRINLLRRPAQEGPLSDIYLLQSERNSIRNMLLNDDNMVPVNESDFGFALSDTAIVYLNELFDKMNSYITNLSDMIRMYTTSYYRTLIKSKTDINDIIEVLKKVKTNIKTLSKDVQESENPSQYVDIIRSFSQKNKLGLDCLTTFKNISILNEYLSDLEGLSNSKKYSSLLWSEPIEKISKFIDENLMKYQFIQNLYNFLNTYEIQKIRKSYHKVLEKVDELVDINLNVENGKDYKTDVDLIDQVNEILKTNIKHRVDFICKENTLIVIDYIVLISEFGDKYFSACDAKKVVILAMHTIYIDEDLVYDWLKGKYLTIISPIWNVRGSRKINLDGASGGEALPKADIGEIGMNGQNGKAGGKFYGIGMNFINGGNLLISASGGKGQDGQDGGDGEDGHGGAAGDERTKELIDEEGFSFSGVNYKEKTYVAAGKEGSTGGDAGAGGTGGIGGKKGSVIIHNIGNEEHEITVLTEEGQQGRNGKNGKPGKGGIKGCDKVIKKQSVSIFGFKLDLGENKDEVNCFLRTVDGRVRKSEKRLDHGLESTYHDNDSPLCIHVERFQSYYMSRLNQHLTDGVTKTFINDMKLTKY